MEVLVSAEVFETFNGGHSWSNKKSDGPCNFNGISFKLNSSIFYIMADRFNTFELK
jgi:hypothetical protein